MVKGGGGEKKMTGEHSTGQGLRTFRNLINQKDYWKGRQGLKEKNIPGGNIKLFFFWAQGSKKTQGVRQRRRQRKKGEARLGNAKSFLENRIARCRGGGNVHGWNKGAWRDRRGAPPHSEGKERVGNKKHHKPPPGGQNRLEKREHRKRKVGKTQEDKRENKRPGEKKSQNKGPFREGGLGKGMLPSAGVDNFFLNVAKGNVKGRGTARKKKKDRAN